MGSYDGPSLRDVLIRVAHCARLADEKEETELYEVDKVKLFEYRKGGDGGDGWKEIGVGFLRVYRHKVTKKRRIVSRVEGTGKLILNVPLYPLAQTGLSKKDVTYNVVMQDDKKAGGGEQAAASMRRFMIRTKAADVAQALKEALDKYKEDDDKEDEPSTAEQNEDDEEQDDDDDNDDDDEDQDDDDDDDDNGDGDEDDGADAN